VRRNPRHLGNVLNIIPLLVTLGEPQKALAAVSAIEATFPGHPRIAAIKNQIMIRVITDRDMVAKKEGPFEYTYPRKLSSLPGDPIATIMADFRKAHDEVGKLLAFRPSRVIVKIHLLTGIDNPAFYSLDDDAITISAEFFIKPDPKKKLPISAEQIRAFASHMVAHEYVHMAFAHKVGYNEFKNAKVSIPIWLLEGIAEWGSGGIGTLPQKPDQIRALFKSGFLDDKQMVAAISVLNFGKSASDNLKAYIQGFYIVKFLMGRRDTMRGAIDAYLAFNKELLKTADIDALLVKHYGLRRKAFEEGWRDQIRHDLLEPGMPRLASIDTPAAVAKGPTHGGLEKSPATP
jgi:hypothetical protein